MVKLAREDIRTTEVLELEGFHLFHFQLSSCSQKVRIFLNLKGIAWESHPVDLTRSENLTEYYLGINPRGLVPALVHDGAVHIESNDILLYLESLVPEPPLIPAQEAAAVRRLLEIEDGLHLDLRTLTFTLLPQPPEVKPLRALDDYAQLGSGTIGGVADPRKAVEIDFWKTYLAGKIGRDDICQSVHRFCSRLDEVENLLGDKDYILGGLSLIDIAWFVYVERLLAVGYPFAELHPRLAAWHRRLREREEFVRETEFPAELAAVIAAHREAQAADGSGLRNLCAI